MDKVNNVFINDDNSQYSDYPLFLFFRINYGGNNLNSNNNNGNEDYDNKLKNFYNSIHDIIRDSFGDN